jgi:hypothetical protein
MRYKDHRNASRLQFSNQFKEPIGLGQGQTGRWLVHHDDLRVSGQRLRDFNQLLLCNRQSAQRGAWRNVEPHLFQVSLRLISDSIPIHETQGTAKEWFPSEKDVSADVEIVEVIEFLVNQADA